MMRKEIILVGAVSKKLKKKNGSNRTESIIDAILKIYQGHRKMNKEFILQMSSENCPFCCGGNCCKSTIPGSRCSIYICPFYDNEEYMRIKKDTEKLERVMKEILQARSKAMIEGRKPKILVIDKGRYKALTGKEYDGKNGNIVGSVYGMEVHVSEEEDDLIVTEKTIGDFIFNVAEAKIEGSYINAPILILKLISDYAEGDSGIDLKKLYNSKVTIKIKE